MENQQSIGDQFLHAIRRIIEDNMGDENFSVSLLARDIGLSRSMLHRKLIRLTGKSATKLITEIRLTRAKELIENDTATISEIAYMVGFTSPSYFNKVFKKTYDISPGEVRKQGSGKLSHLTVVKESGIHGSTRSKRSRSYLIAGRNVLMIIIVAGGAASMILGLLDHVSPLSRLPKWTMILIVVLLSMAFFISVILSWTSDMYLDEGAVKTMPAPKIKAGKEHPLSNRWKIASYISFIAIVALVVLNTITPKEIFDKSIAVLPFYNDSPDQENHYILNGYRMAVLDNLCKIKDLTVVHLLVEQYRNTDKGVSEIAKELNVGYLLCAGGQIYGNNIRLTVQLMNADGKILWSKAYNRKITSVEDNITLQSDIALLTAREIDAIITTEEKRLIEKVPTTNLTAFDFYQRGQEELNNYWSGDRDQENLDKAEYFYNKAISYDSSYAEAYAGLASVFIAKRSWSDYFSETYLDSALVLANEALSYDRTLSEAYLIRGLYFFSRGDSKSAERAFDTGIAYNPNDWQLYYEKATVFERISSVEVLKNAYKAASLHRGSKLADILKLIARAYTHSGFYDQAKEIANELAELGDSVAYFDILGFIEMNQQNYLKAIDNYLQAHRIDTTNNLKLAHLYMWTKQYEQSLKYYKKYLGSSKANDEILTWNSQSIGYAYWINGYKKEGDYYIQKQLEYAMQELQLNRVKSDQLFIYYDLATVYSFYGETEKALDNLKRLDQREIFHSWFVNLINVDPMLENIRDEPEFKKILSDVEAKYQEEHERVRKWLEENDML